MYYYIILLFLAVVPSYVLAKYVYQNDVIEKESKSLLTKLFFGGFLSALIAIIISLIIDYFVKSDEMLTSLPKTFIYAFLMVGVVEETSKYIVLRKITWNNREFNYIYDALVYATYVSLGFATIENIMYVFEYGIHTAVTRALLAVPGHLSFGIFMGYFYGFSKKYYLKNDRKNYKINNLLTLLAPSLGHGIFDFCLFSNNSIFLLGYFVYVVILFKVASNLLKKVSKEDMQLVNTNSFHYCPYCGSVAKGLYCSNCGNRLYK